MTEEEIKEYNLKVFKYLDLGEEFSLDIDIENETRSKLSEEKYKLLYQDGKNIIWHINNLVVKIKEPRLEALIQRKQDKNPLLQFLK